ncbi:MAG: hypothetical protein LBW85_08880 [Deltaproteobacteria bacterium]|jgi:hypothetical protein|nr:hypothetical protein [Deltaproteobacteria bacterium]
MRKNVIVSAISLLLLLAAPRLAQAQSGGAYGKLTQVFEPGIVGATTDYLESVLGPAKRKDQLGDTTFREYQVGGCRVEVTGGDTVKTIAVPELSSGCSFDFAKLATNPDVTGPVSAFGMTFGDLYRALSLPDIEFRRDCLHLCGNAAAPEIGFNFVTPLRGRLHLSAWLYLTGEEKDRKGKDVFDLAEEFKSYLISRQGQDKVYSVEYDISREDSDRAMGLFEDSYVNAVQIGQDN